MAFYKSVFFFLFVVVCMCACMPLSLAEVTEEPAPAVQKQEPTFQLTEKDKELFKEMGATDEQTEKAAGMLEGANLQELMNDPALMKNMGSFADAAKLLNSPEIQEMLKSPEMQEMMKALADPNSPQMQQMMKMLEDPNSPEMKQIMGLLGDPNALGLDMEKLMSEMGEAPSAWAKFKGLFKFGKKSEPQTEESQPEERKLQEEKDEGSNTEEELKNGASWAKLKGLVKLGKFGPQTEAEESQPEERKLQGSISEEDLNNFKKALEAFEDDILSVNKAAEKVESQPEGRRLQEEKDEGSNTEEELNNLKRVLQAIEDEILSVNEATEEVESQPEGRRLQEEKDEGSNTEEELNNLKRVLQAIEDEILSVNEAAEEVESQPEVRRLEGEIEGSNTEEEPKLEEIAKYIEDANEAAQEVDAGTQSSTETTSQGGEVEAESEASTVTEREEKGVLGSIFRSFSEAISSVTRKANAAFSSIASERKDNEILNAVCILNSLHFGIAHNCVKQRGNESLDRSVQYYIGKIRGHLEKRHALAVAADEKLGQLRIREVPNDEELKEQLRQAIYESQTDDKLMSMGTQEWSGLLANLIRDKCPNAAI